MLRLFSLCHHLEIYKERQKRGRNHGDRLGGIAHLLPAFSVAVRSGTMAYKAAASHVWPWRVHSMNVKGRW